MRAARTDANHAEIREGLRQCGRRVFDTSRLGQGFPDLLVLTASGRLVLLEVKMPGKGLTPDELQFFATWAPPPSPPQCPIQIVTTLGQALDVTW
jgi:hypothetical protein